MKIRIGFVSNSSSTSYVIAITRDFKLSDEQKQLLGDYYNEYEDEKDQITIEQIEKLFQKTLEKLCSSSQVWKDDTPLFDSMIRTLKEKIVLAEIDGSPDEGCCVNVLSDKNKDDFIAKMQKLLPQGPH